ncbi:DNA/RNA non-specific endonuclease [Pedobacter sp.]
MQKKLMQLYFSLLLLISISSFSCKKADASSVIEEPERPSIEENFEKGVKSSYTEAELQLESGSWIFNDALIGNLSSDVKNGANAVRIRNNGYIYTNFRTTASISAISLKYAKYGNDSEGKFVVLYSLTTDTAWKALSDTILVNNTSLKSLDLKLKISGEIRFKILKIDGTSNRINIDDFIVAGSKTGTQNQSSNQSVNHILLGNPSNATYDIVNFENYLLEQPYYVSSYNSSKGIPNWVSWHLEEKDLGAAKRQDDFRANTSLPSSWFIVQNSSYSGSGFDRGHMCPSADRTSTTEANSATFLMTNMVPQAPRNNQGVWANLEDYTRTLVKAGNEAYIISGTFGSGGTGSQGGITYSLQSGKITVPNAVWKIILVLPLGDDDLTRINSNTRIIAVLIPNENSVGSNWRDYRTNIKTIEGKTGYQFLSVLSANLRNILIEKIDNQ